MKTQLTGQDFCAMIEGAAKAISLEKQLINDLNVFPVPDGDTGTNMTLTMQSPIGEIQKKNPKTVSEAADVTAAALLRGARGNSGVILSLLFRGLSKGLKGLDTATSLVFASAMCEGVDAAYKAVMKPAEGTMLTVSRVASQGALEFAADNPCIEETLVHTIKVGYEALARTIDQNPVLKKAGVIDAGGKGYIIILEGMLNALQGKEIVASGEVMEKPIAADIADFSVFDEGEINFEYCTEFIIDRETDKDPDALRGFLDAIGDSLVLIDDEEVIKVHVHTDEPLRALSEAITYGRLLNVKIENMRDQMLEKQAEQSEEAIAPAEKPLGFVAVSAGVGLSEVFRDLGVDAIVTGGQTMNPSTDELLKAIHSVPAETVFVLPNNKNIFLAASQAVPLAEKKVEVIATKDVAQGVSALLALNPDASVAENLEGMTEAMKRVHTAQITYAARDSEFDGHDIKAGQHLALYDGALLGSSDDFDGILEKATAALSQTDPEFIMLYYGEGVTEEKAQAASEKITAQIPKAEVSIINGGQPVYYFMISAE